MCDQNARPDSFRDRCGVTIAICETADKDKQFPVFFKNQYGSEQTTLFRVAKIGLNMRALTRQ